MNRPDPTGGCELAKARDEWYAFAPNPADERRERTLDAVGDWEGRFGPQDVHVHDSAEAYVGDE